MKIIILKLIKWTIYKMSEYTPPKIKNSDNNYHVAKSALAVNEFINFLSNETQNTKQD